MGWGESRGRLVPAHADQCLLHLGHSNGEGKHWTMLRWLWLSGAPPSGLQPGTPGNLCQHGGHIMDPTFSSLLSLHRQWLLRRGKCHELRDREMGVGAEMRQK